MATETRFLDNLKKLGLNDYEARGYLALMERRSLTATQIAALSRIPRTKVYDVTESLIKKGLCSLFPGKINKYRGLEISAVADSLLRENERAFNERRGQIQEATENLKEQLSAIYGHVREDVDPLEYIEIIRDPAMAAKRFLSLRENSECEEVAFVRGPFTGDKESLKQQVKAQCERFKRKHRRARAIYEIKDDEDRWQLELIEIAVKSGGEEARILKQLPLKACVFDRKVVLLSLQDPVRQKESLTTVVIEHPDLAMGLRTLFDFLWQTASDYETFGA